jgi:hypothetical protein
MSSSERLESREDDAPPPPPESDWVRTENNEAAWSNYTGESGREEQTGEALEGRPLVTPETFPEFDPAFLSDDVSDRSEPVDQPTEVWARPEGDAEGEIVVRAPESRATSEDIDSAGWANAEALKASLATDSPLDNQEERVAEARLMVNEALDGSDRGEQQQESEVSVAGQNDVPSLPEARLFEESSPTERAGDELVQEVRPTSPDGVETSRPLLHEYRASEPEWDLVDPDLRLQSDIKPEPGQAPDVWVDTINGAGSDHPGRETNCVDCARAVESTWRGNPEVAARLADTDGTGTTRERISDWVGTEFAKTDYSGIETKLTELGPGASAIIASDWSSPFGGGHAYNALNSDGKILLVDGQSGVVEDWPPSAGWTEQDVADSEAIFFDRNGRTCDTKSNE